jgi:Fe-S cluster assembly protein SufD
MEQVVDITYEEALVNKLQELVPNARNQYVQKFLEHGFPHRKDEEYKFTYVKKFVEKAIDPSVLGTATGVTKADVEKELVDQVGHHLVFINGAFNEEYSTLLDDKTNVSIETDLNSIGKHAKLEQDIFAQLNSAFTPHALIVDVPGGHESHDLYIYHFVDNTVTSACFPRIVINAGKSAEVKAYEKTILKGSAPVFMNRVLEAGTAQNASINVTKIQEYPDFVYEIDGIFATQHKDSRFYANTFAFSGGMIRNNLNIDLDEEHCETHMHGLYLLDGKSHVDNHTTVDHKLPNSYSNELYKGIVDEKAQAVFNGKIFVRPGAQKTNAFQANNNISLSETATIHTKPQLEIWADDVSCSHGCTIGQLDEEAIFYLRARGIDQKTAKAMMLVAFAEEAFEYVPFDFVKERLHQTIEKRLLG